MDDTLNKAVSGQRVLIVDDEPMVCQTLSLIFKTHAYQTREVDSAEEALNVIASWIPQVAILDVGLPQMNGVELAALIRRQCPSCHILLFSDRPESGGVEEASTGGEIFEIVAKPVHPDFLLNWVSMRLAS